jgi:hypothetical protein
MSSPSIMQFQTIGSTRTQREALAGLAQSGEGCDRTCYMTEDEIAAMRARDAMLDQLKRLRPHGLRLTPQNLMVAAELVRFALAEAHEFYGRIWIRAT